jgi:DNA repair protein RadC
MKRSTPLSDGSRSQEIAEIQVSYRTKVRPSERKQIHSSKEAENLFRSVWNRDTIELRESMLVMLLNRANKVLGYFNVSEGGTAGTVVDAKLVFAVALKCQAHGFILCHNHPSGNLKPSQSDIDLTRKMKEAGKFLEIQLLDHIILTVESYVSLADEGFI